MSALLADDDGDDVEEVYKEVDVEECKEAEECLVGEDMTPRVAGQV